ncbi:MAG: DUF4292 domain-containing protein [Flavobacterium sp.]|nr:MAG: DUF4292 domain-containing protein [Flavobacterium sp.]
MKRNILNSLILASLTIIAVSCKPKKVIVATPTVSTEKVEVGADKKKENLALLKGKDLAFNTLSLKGKTSLDVDGDVNNVTMNIRIEKDKKIWVSVTGLAGIEGVRAVITPDSLLMRNNLQKTFVQKPFSYIYGFTNKQVNFGLLQAILSGNTIDEFMTEKSNLDQEGGVWALSGSASDLVYKVLFNTLLKPAEVNLNDPKSGHALKVVYGDYTQINNALFPSTLKLNSMAGSKKINIAIEFNKIDTNVPLTFPFSIPKNFERVN